MMEDFNLNVFGFVNGKADDETRALLKANGFRWAPSQGAWQRQLTPNGVRAAKYVMKEIEQCKS